MRKYILAVAMCALALVAACQQADAQMSNNEGAMVAMWFAADKLDAPMDSYTFRSHRFDVEAWRIGDVTVRYRSSDTRACRVAWALAVVSALDNVGYGEWDVTARCNGTTVTGHADFDSRRYNVRQSRGGSIIFRNSWRGN